MRRRSLLLKTAAVLVTGRVALLPRLAWAAGPTTQCACDMPMAPTISSLQACVACCAAMGHIDNSGIAKSLASTLSAAQAALARGQTGTALSILRVFPAEVEAQAGRHIVALHATCLEMHADLVIAALSKGA